MENYLTSIDLANVGGLRIAGTIYTPAQLMKGAYLVSEGIHSKMQGARQLSVVETVFRKISNTLHNFHIHEIGASRAAKKEFKKVFPTFSERTDSILDAIKPIGNLIH
jgi:hypothetical protein